MIPAGTLRVRSVSIHAFRGEGDAAATAPAAGNAVSIHAFRGEGDLLKQELFLTVAVFQSTPSGGKATISAAIRSFGFLGFNPRLPGGRRLEAVQDIPNPATVSIHAFRGEGDAIVNTRKVYRDTGVSIHAFRGEGDSMLTLSPL